MRLYVCMHGHVYVYADSFFLGIKEFRYALI